MKAAASFGTTGINPISAFGFSTRSSRVHFDDLDREIGVPTSDDTTLATPPLETLGVQPHTHSPQSMEFVKSSSSFTVPRQRETSRGVCVSAAPQPPSRSFPGETIAGPSDRDIDPANRGSRAPAENTERCGPPARPRGVCPLPVLATDRTWASRMSPGGGSCRTRRSA